jgi:GNAT superfamily N-acetyltransferase
VDDNDLPPLLIVPLTTLPDDRLTELLADSERTGCRIIRRFVEEWDSGVNRFDRAGERLFAALLGGVMVGVCGLNIDPYADAPRVGRVRHLYVLDHYRRAGIGRRLVRTAIEAAQGVFGRLRLRTANPVAARFYEGLGFLSVAGETDCTHALALQIED